MSLKNVLACVKKHKKFLITTHTNPEGDALGSELAFYLLLKKLGKQAIIINQDIIPYEYSFLPEVNKIKKYGKKSRNIKFESFVILDCSDLNRCGEVSALNRINNHILNIDHHVSNEKFGEINWVEPGASCTCEMIYKLYKKLHITIDKKAALDLYAGILTDTGSFRYTNTTSFTHRVVADLLKHNLNVTQIYKKVYENIPFVDMQLLTKILLAMKRQVNGKLVWLEIKKDLLRNKRIFFDLSEEILSFCRAIKGVEVAVLFKENLGVNNDIRINFRSQGGVDVNKIAQTFGGGGHKTASGATVRGSLASVRNKVLRKIKEYL